MVYKTEVNFRPELKVGTFTWAVYQTDDELCPKSWKVVASGAAPGYVVASQRARNALREVSGYAIPV